MAENSAGLVESRHLGKFVLSLDSEGSGEYKFRVHTLDGKLRTQVAEDWVRGVCNNMQRSLPPGEQRLRVTEFWSGEGFGLSVTADDYDSARELCMGLLVEMKQTVSVHAGRTPEWVDTLSVDPGQVRPDSFTAEAVDGELVAGELTVSY